MSDKVMNSGVIVHGFFDSEFFDQMVQSDERVVYVLEGRPNLESAQATCDALLKRKIKPIVIADNMPGFLFSRGLIIKTYISYQNKKNHEYISPVGCLILAILSKTHDVPVYAHESQGQQLLLSRPRDVLYFNDVRVAPRGVKAYVPLLENIPKKYITHNLDLVPN